MFAYFIILLHKAACMFPVQKGLSNSTRIQNHFSVRSSNEN